MSDPWLKFYPTDWRSDPALRMCSAAARGVWIDLICLMHEATPYGHLLVNGRCPTDAQVAVLTGTPPDQLTQCLRELEDAGVFSRTKDGTIYSRKLTRMAKKAATARNNGRKGGNPSLRKRGDNVALDNPMVKGEDKPQKPEARSQTGKKDADASLWRDDFERFWDMFPHRNGKKTARKDCEQRFARAVKSGVDGAVIAAAAEAYRRDPDVCRGYGRAADTWLNQRGWEDEAAPRLQIVQGEPRHGKPTKSSDQLSAFLAGARLSS